MRALPSGVWPVAAVTTPRMLPPLWATALDAHTTAKAATPHGLRYRMNERCGDVS
jgi:hypothetical protein